jgi:hypothetical protein
MIYQASEIDRIGIIPNARRQLDVVRLKNGSTIRGTIVEQVPNVSYKIQTLDGNEMFYQVAEVSSITKETGSGGRSSSVKSGGGGGATGAGVMRIGLTLSYSIGGDNYADA